MRILGVIIVCWIVGGVALVYVRQKYVKPYLSRRHIAALERENARLDALLRDEITPRRRSRT